MLCGACFGLLLPLVCSLPVLQSLTRCRYYRSFFCGLEVSASYSYSFISMSRKACSTIMRRWRLPTSRSSRKPRPLPVENGTFPLNSSMKSVTGWGSNLQISTLPIPKQSARSSQTSSCQKRLFPIGICPCITRTLGSKRTFSRAWSRQEKKSFGKKRKKPGISWRLTRQS